MAVTHISYVLTPVVVPHADYPFNLLTAFVNRVVYSYFPQGRNMIKWDAPEVIEGNENTEKSNM